MAIYTPFISSAALFSYICREFESDTPVELMTLASLGKEYLTEFECFQALNKYTKNQGYAVIIREASKGVKNKLVIIRLETIV